ncbi:MAG: hypothetical protein AAB592_01230 [Patescibacteria group bacterium]
MSITLAKAVRATITYFDLLDFALTLDEAWEYLYGCSATREEVQKCLDEFVKNGEISYQAPYYMMPGREALFEIRLKKKETEKKLWSVVERFALVLRSIPFVKMVAVCNNLAFGNVTDASDIDLFIVTERGRMFSARACATVLTQLTGRRRHGDKIAGRFCLSFFADESALSLGKIAIKDDIYLAYWLKTLTPICGAKTYEKLLEQNRWVERFFGRPVTPRLQRLGVGSELRKTAERVLPPSFEKSMRKFQVRRATEKMNKLQNTSGTVISDTVLKFHDNDRREDVRERFFQSIA